MSKQNKKPEDSNPTDPTAPKVRKKREYVVKTDQTRGLTPRALKFIEFFIATGQAKKSAILAGYSPHTATTGAHLLLSKPAIANEIERRMRDAIKKGDITTEIVLREVAGMAFGIPKADLTWDAKLKALTLLGKQMALFQDKIQIDVNMTDQERQDKLLALLSRAIGTDTITIEQVRDIPLQILGLTPAPTESAGNQLAEEPAIEATIESNTEPDLDLDTLDLNSLEPV